MAALPLYAAVGWDDSFSRLQSLELVPYSDRPWHRSNMIDELGESP